jgi:hypothetical protein
MCCRKYDDRFLPRAMALSTGHEKPRVELTIW